MSQRNGLAKRSEKGLLTPDNCVVALIDHQPQMLFGVSSTDRQSIINNTLAFAKAAQVFGLPVVLSTVETKSFSGYMWPQLAALFPGRTPIERSSMNLGRQELCRRHREKQVRRRSSSRVSSSTRRPLLSPPEKAIYDGYEAALRECGGDGCPMARQEPCCADWALPELLSMVMLEDQGTEDQQEHLRFSDGHLSKNHAGSMVPAWTEYALAR